MTKFELMTQILQLLEDLTSERHTSVQILSVRHSPGSCMRSMYVYVPCGRMRLKIPEHVYMNRPLSSRFLMSLTAKFNHIHLELLDKESSNCCFNTFIIPASQHGL